MNVHRRFVLFGCVLGLLAGIQAGRAADTPNQLTEEDKAGGWKLLFDGKTTKGWRMFKKNSFPDKEWRVEDGWLHCIGSNTLDLVTADEFDNFELSWEWKQPKGGNSGLKYFISEKRSSPIGHEYQMIDDENHEDAKAGAGKRVTAAFYDVLKPQRPAPTKPPGEINKSRVVVNGNHVEHWLNGAKVLEYSCGSEEVKKAVAASKFKNTPDFGEKIKAHILLQDHHSEVWFRDLKVRILPANGV